jgi:hypothetical protein
MSEAAPMYRPQNGSDTRLTPVDTRKQGFLGATGVRKNAKTPGKQGFCILKLLYESGALPLS